jgi:hypothetical protein
LRAACEIRRESEGKSRMTRSLGEFDAEALAIDALGFLAEDMERLTRFLALTGIAPETLRAAAREPSFLLATLEHLAADDALILAFAANRRIEPGAVIAARDRLAGRPGAEFV